MEKKTQLDGWNNHFSEQYNRTVDLPVQDVDFLESIVQRENIIEKEE